MRSFAGKQENFEEEYAADYTDIAENAPIFLELLIITALSLCTLVCPNAAEQPVKLFMAPRGNFTPFILIFWSHSKPVLVEAYCSGRLQLSWLCWSQFH